MEWEKGSVRVVATWISDRCAAGRSEVPTGWGGGGGPGEASSVDWQHRGLGDEGGHGNYGSG